MSPPNLKTCDTNTEVINTEDTFTFREVTEPLYHK